MSKELVESCRKMKNLFWHINMQNVMDIFNIKISIMWYHITQHVVCRLMHHVRTNTEPRHHHGIVSALTLLAFSGQVITWAVIKRLWILILTALSWINCTCSVTQLHNALLPWKAAITANTDGDVIPSHAYKDIHHVILSNLELAVEPRRAIHCFVEAIHTEVTAGNGGVANSKCLDQGIMEEHILFLEGEI